MTIVEFEQGNLLDEFKESNEHRFGNHCQSFIVTAYTEEEYAIDIKFTASGNLLDQTEIDNLEIDIESVDGERDIDPALKSAMEYQLKGLFEI